ncbi:MAG: pilus assembly protein PilM [Clostridiales bacterium]|nr:pilus assembly protein PilM [Clostridiales bacterium]
MAKKVLSIEIGLRRIKLCEMDYKVAKPKVYKAVMFDTPNGSVEDGFIRDPQTLGAAIRRVISENAIKTKDVVFVVNSTKIASREAVIPFVKDSLIQGIVESGAQDYFPVNVAEYTFSYKVLERVKDGQDKGIKLLLLAAPDQIVQSYYAFAKSLGLNVESMDYVGNSSFQIMKREISSGYNVVVQINDENTMISIIKGMDLLLQRTVTYGMSTVYDAVLRNPIFGAKSESEAEIELEKNEILYSALDTSEYDSVSALQLDPAQKQVMLDRVRGREEVTDSLSYHVNNVVRVIDYFLSKNPGRTISKVYITGIGAKVRGMGHLFSHELDLPAERLDKLHSVNFTKDVYLSGMAQVEFISVLGAAIEPVGFKSKDNLRSAERKSNVQGALYIFVGCIAISVLLVGAGALKYQTAKSKNSDLESQIQSLSYVQQVYDDYKTADMRYNQMLEFDKTTGTVNEALNDLLTELEQTLPKNMTVKELSSTDASALAASGTTDGSGNNYGIGSVTLRIDSKTYVSAAQMLLNFQGIDHIQSPVIGSMTAEVNTDTGKAESWRYYVTFVFNSNEPVPEEEAAEEAAE